MAITGTLDDSGRDLVLTRTVGAPIEEIWEHLSRSELLAAWFGTFTGDPASGTVEVTMTAEPGEAVAAEYTLHACRAPRLLTVSSAMGEDTWTLSLELEEIGTDSGSTRVALRHRDLPREMLPYVGPGWEWYLDRLTGAVTDGPIPGMDVWDGQYMTLGEEYAALGR